MSPTIRTGVLFLHILVSVMVAASGPLQAGSPSAADVLSEGSASQWYAGAENATARVSDATDRVMAGSRSIRFETTGAFDTWAGGPAGKAAAWNLDAAGIGGLAFWMYSENDSEFGFQNSSPWIRLYTGAQSYFELHATRELMNECRGRWVRFVVPISGNTDWTVSTVGTPSTTNVNWIEFHADTWGDAGLRYWLDGLEFVPRQISALSLNMSSLRLWRGYRWQNLQVKARTGSDELAIDSTRALWSSSNPAVVEVGNDGVLEARAAGAGTVTASYSGLTAAVQVQVLDAALPPVHESLPPDLTTPAAGALFEIPVLIMRFLPTIDGVNLDVAQARDYFAPGEITLAAMKAKLWIFDTRTKWMIEEASRFRGYQNPSAQPSLGVRVVDMITVYEQMPPGLNRQQDSAGNPLPEVDYPRMFERFGVDHYVNDLGVKEIWIWNGGMDASFPSYDPAVCRPEYGRSMPESNMSSRVTGDISNSYRWDDLPVYDHTYVVYGQNIRRTHAEAIHNRGHQLEAILSHVDWLRSGNNNLFWDRFCGRNSDGSFAPGRAGNCHFPPNGAADYDYLNPRLIASDCEDWTPASTGAKKYVNADTWGQLPYTWPAVGSTIEQKTESQYYLYWMQNMPGRNNAIAYGSFRLTNWWVFTADWDNAIGNGLGLYGAASVLLRIDTQPVPQTVASGGTAIFTVAASGSPVPNSWQWKKGGTSIAGATTATLSLTNVQPSAAGNYTVTVGNGLDSVTSDSAALTVNQAPILTTQPAPQTANVGGNGRFSVSATGSPAPRYQWQTEDFVWMHVPGEADFVRFLSPLTDTGFTPDPARGEYLEHTDGDFVGGTIPNDIGKAVGPTHFIFRDGSIIPGHASVVQTGDRFVTASPTDQPLTDVLGNYVFFQKIALYRTRYLQVLTWVDLSDGSSFSGTGTSTLTVSAVTAGMSGNQFRCRVSNGIAPDVYSDAATLTVAAVSAPTITSQPQPLGGVAGQSGFLSVGAAGASGYQWYKGGVAVPGATGSTLAFPALSSANAGIYDCAVTGAGGVTLSAPVVVGLVPVAGDRTAGAVSTYLLNIQHPKGQVYDQFLLAGAAGTFTAAPDKIARCSYLDENECIVQVEMSGAGAITIVLAGATGPMAPALYNQSGIEYMKGKATVILTGADATTHFTIYSVGTFTNPGVTRPEVNYAGWANVAAAGILSTTGGLGGIHQGNVGYNASTGLTGLYAPTVTSVGGLVVVHGIQASDSAQPYLFFGTGGTADVKIAGSSLAQPNADGITVRGLSRVTMGAGQDSCGRAAPALALRSAFFTDTGLDVTAGLVVGP